MAKQRRACDGCHKRKIQCDLTEAGPKCNWCTHRNLPCTFNRVKVKVNRKSKKKAIQEDISERLGRIEKFIANTQPLNDGNTTAAESPNSSTSSSLGHVTSESSGKPQTYAQSSCEVRPKPERWNGRAACGHIYFAGSYLGNIISPTHMPTFSPEGEAWIESATGERPNFDRFYVIEHTSCLSMNTSFKARSKGSADTELPPVWIIQAFFDEFLKSGIRHVFPIIEEVLFQDTLRLAYGPEPVSPRDPAEYLTARAFVWAYSALMQFQFPSIPASDHIDGWTSAARAQALIHECLEHASVTLVQTLVILQLHSMVMGRMQAGVMFHTMACRMCQDLGAHVLLPPVPSEQPPTFQERVSEQQRRIFWTLYIFDKNIALRTGQPPLMSDEYCDLTLPYRYLEERFDYMEEQLNGPSRQLMLFGDIRLSILKSKVCRDLYSVQSLRKSDAEILRSIRELDEELESWRVSLPFDFKPSVSELPSDENNWNVELKAARAVQHVELHLEYHHLVATIHCASGRFVKSAKGFNDPRTVGLQSSLELSVEASRTTIIYLGVAIDVLPCEVYWAFLFYPVAALMTLFFNVLRNPHAQQAADDVKLIGLAGNLISRMPSHETFKLYETSHFERLDAFIAEIKRLGEKAVSKARGGSNKWC